MFSNLFLSGLRNLDAPLHAPLRSTDLEEYGREEQEKPERRPGSCAAFVKKWRRAVGRATKAKKPTQAKALDDVVVVTE